MNKRQTYATKLTKEDLIKGGITLITEDGLVFKGEKQAAISTTSGGYFVVNIYDFDEAGNKVKRPITRTFKGCKKPSETYVYNTKVVGLHRAI